MRKGRKLPDHQSKHHELNRAENSEHLTVTSFQNNNKIIQFQLQPEKFANNRHFVRENLDMES